LVDEAEDAQSKVNVCHNCRQEVLQEYPSKCPYCGSYNLARVDKSELEKYVVDKSKLPKNLDRLEDPKEAKCPNCGGLGKITAEVGHFHRDYYFKQYECMMCHKKFHTETYVLDVIGIKHKYPRRM